MSESLLPDAENILIKNLGITLEELSSAQSEVTLSVLAAMREYGEEVKRITLENYDLKSELFKFVAHFRAMGSIGLQQNGRFPKTEDIIDRYFTDPITVKKVPPIEECKPLD